MAFLRGFFGGRARRPTEQYVRGLMEEPDPAEVSWLAEVATAGDHDRALWELRYFKRALGLLIAQRDALDDRTASSVARALTGVMTQDRSVAADMIRLSERQFNERLGAYREMMSLRGTGEGVGDRLGRTLLLLAGAGRMGNDELRQAARTADRYLTTASERLRGAFGAASFPEGSAPVG